MSHIAKPTRAERDARLEDLQERLSVEQRKLLEFLLNFNYDHETPKGLEILCGYYKVLVSDEEKANHAYVKGRKEAGSLRRALAEYYRDLGVDPRSEPSETGDRVVHIEIAEGRHGYKPIITWRPKVSGSSGASLPPMEQAATGRATDNEILRTWKVFQVSEIVRRLKECRKTVRICITAWPELDRCSAPLRKALEKGCAVEIMLWDPSPKEAFVTLRGKSITEGKDPDYVRRTIRANHISLEPLLEFSGLTCKHCRGQASVGIFWIDDLIYFIPYWVGAPLTDGPLFLTKETSKIGKYLQEQYALMTASSR